MTAILIAPDSFKGTFSASEIARLIGACIPNSEKKHEITLQPLADGGEGSLEILADAYQAKVLSAQVTGPYGHQVKAKYAVAGELALLEMAEASGLCHAKHTVLRPDMATTYGTGELIKTAVHGGCKKIILGLGGSATVDGGAGALQALGAMLADAQGQAIPFGNQGLGDLARLSFEKAISVLEHTNLILATDVTNPLLGENGAVYVYGKQKGVQHQALSEFESRMQHFANCVERVQEKTFRQISGTGAAGGLAFGLMAVGGQIASGFQLISEHVWLEEKIKRADLVITGEGKFDGSSLSGKVTGSVLALCKLHRKPCYVICGTAASVPHEIFRQEVKIMPLFQPSEIGSLDLTAETPKRLHVILPSII